MKMYSFNWSRMKHGIAVVVILFAAILNLSAYVQAAGVELWKDKGYTVDKVLVLSRHNIRTPLISEGSPARRLQPEGWFSWTVPRGDLSILGGQMETAMGQFFRRYLVAEGFMDERWIPEPGQARFYASAYQRTLATARYFGAGMLPLTDVVVERRVEVNKKDPVFLARPPFDNAAFRQRVNDDVQEYANDKKVLANCTDSLKSLNKVFELPKNGIKEFSISSFNPTVDEKGIHNSIEVRQAVALADAMVMQYYEVPDKIKAAFGHDLTLDEWKAIGKMTDISLMLSYGKPTMAAYCSKLLAQEMLKELDNADRRFTFLCGHDTTVIPFMTAMEADVEKPGVITEGCPIGGKVLLQQLQGKDGQKYVALSMVYASVDQLRERARLDMENPPVISPITLKGVKKNEDGVYALQDVKNRLQGIVEKADAVVK